MRPGLFVRLDKEACQFVADRKAVAEEKRIAAFDDLQDAIGAPRFRWIDDVGDPLPARAIRMESRFPQATRDAIAARGYTVEMLGAWSMRVGGVQGILADGTTGWIAGAADPRRNGYAIGW